MAGRYPNFNYKKLDKLLHNRLRLAIMASVSKSDEVDFVSLKNAVAATDGNLSVQLMNLEDEDYISTKRAFHNNRLQTLISITEKGSTAMATYHEMLQRWLSQK